MPQPNPKDTEWLDEILETLVQTAYGTIWYDYVEQIKLPELAIAKAAILTHLDSEIFKARIDELMFLDERGGATRRINDLTKELKDSQDE